MIIYQIYRDDFLDPPNCVGKYGDIFPKNLRLPHIYCPTCQARNSWERGFGIPEAALLQNHPFLLEIEELLDKLKAEGSDTTKKVIDYIDANNGEITSELSLESEMSGTMTPKEFASLAKQLRDSLGLSSDRLIVPNATLGLRHEVYCFHPIPDFQILSLYFDCYPIITVQKFVLEMLQLKHITGWVSYPLLIHGVIPCQYKLDNQFIDLAVSDFFITGFGGLPSNYDRKHYHERLCPECGFLRWWISENHQTQELDEDAWDGSDFFRFAGVLGVFVTENIKQLFEHSQITGCLFRPSTVPYDEWKQSL